MRQLDIFDDSRSILLANDIAAALLRRDGPGAAAAIAKLRDEDPRHRDLAAFDCLLAFVEGEVVAPEPADTPVIAALVADADTRISPAAGVLGQHAEAFLRPLWRRLAAAGTGFDAAMAEAHPAALWLRAGDHAAAEAAARSIAGGGRLAPVQRWLCLALHPRTGLDGILDPLFRFAWLAPDRLAGLVAELDEPLLERSWRQFLADPGTLDADWFPAWYLAEHPQTPLGDTAASASTPAADACRRLARVLALERQGHSPALVQQRAKLRALDETFFAWYMARRTVSHR